jgi:hypothetical protein
MKASAKSILFQMVIVCNLLFLDCINNPNAGGTTDTGNARVAAVIYTHDGLRASGVKVTVTPANYLPVAGSYSAVDSSELQEFFTNDSGAFVISKINEGKYAIEVNDENSCAAMLNISVGSSDSQTISLKDTLQPYATITGDAGILKDSSDNRYILIYGSSRIIPVKKDGSFVIEKLPEGVFHLKIIAGSKYDESIELENVKAYSSQAVSIPFAGWKYRSEIELNTTSTGAGVLTDVVNIPVLIRLTKDNFDFSRASGDGSDCRFSKVSGPPLSFEIEQWDSVFQKAAIWVLIDTVYGNKVQSVNMLYGNPLTVPGADRHAVFDTANGFFAGYHFAGNLYDATVNGYNGIDSSTKNGIDGIIGSSRLFNGSSYINLGDLPDRPSGTISFWFKPGVTIDTSMSHAHGIWGKTSFDSLNFNISLRGKDYYTDSNLTSVSQTGAAGNLITKQENGAGGYYLDSKTDGFTSGTWYYACWCWGEKGNFLYVNGVLENSVQGYKPVSGHASDEIGRSRYDSSNIPFGAARYFNGSLDEFRIDKTVRDPGWIKLCYMNQREDNKLVTIK